MGINVYFFYVFSFEILTKFDPKIEKLVEFTLEKQKISEFS
jgi:hypothetical protein